ncbi:MAG: hypothetical protein LQ337_003099 [Flavoplaca oasis]|nr:MAG: hypothetical protein LQ337_003099 [Flavoplaca oasis]
MVFGRTESTRFRGELATTPIDRSANRWTAKDISFSIRGERMVESSDMSFDTAGGNHIYAPLSVVLAYYSHIPDLLWSSHLGGYRCTIVIPCATQLPDLEMHVGSGTARIRSDRMMGDRLTLPADPSWNRGNIYILSPTFNQVVDP